MHYRTHVSRAQPMGDKIVPKVEIVIHDTIKTEDCNQETFNEDAEAIVRELFRSLPGGTFDQVLRLMLEKKASQLVVSHHSQE